MSKETIAQIIETEKKADRLRADATAEAKVITDTAEADGIALCERVFQETEEEIGEKMEKIRLLNASKEESSKKDSMDEVRLAVGRARMHMETAVNRILDELDDVMK